MGMLKTFCRALEDPASMAVGGVTTDNIAEVFAGGYAYVGTANGIFNKNDILAEDKTAPKQIVRVSLQRVERLDASLPFCRLKSCLSSANDLRSIRMSLMP